MAVRRPLAFVGGDPSEIPTGDTIDPAVLPPSSGAPYVPLTVPAGVTFLIPNAPAPVQVLYSEPIYVQLGGQISIQTGSVLARVS